MAETPYTAYSYLKGPLMAVINAFAQDAVDRAEPLTVAAACAQCRDAALAESAIGAVDMLAALAAIGVGIADTFDLLGSGLTPGARTVLGIVSFTAWLAPAVAAMMRKPVFAAVTQRSLICYRLSRFGHDPVRLLFRAPPDAVHLTGSARRGRLWSAVRYRGPGASKRAVRLSIAWYWRQDLHQVLTALQFAGAAVDVRVGVTALPAAASVNQIQGAAGGL